MQSRKLTVVTASSSESRRGFRIARAILLSSFLLFAIATYSLWRHYQSTRPTFVDETSSQIYPLNAGGWTVYITRTDQVLLDALAVASAACLAAAVALDTFVLSRDDNE